MAKINIHLVPVRFNNYSKLDIYLDGNKVDRLEGKGPKAYQLTDNTVTVQCRQGWMSSPVMKLELQEDEQVDLKVSPNMWFNWLGIYMSLGVILFYFIRIFYDKDVPVLIYAVGPAIIGWAYLMLFKRNRYFKIERTQKITAASLF